MAGMNPLPPGGGPMVRWPGRYLTARASCTRTLDLASVEKGVGHRLRPVKVASVRVVCDQPGEGQGLV